MSNSELEIRYQKLLEEPSNIRAHLPKLYELASNSQVVVEFGTFLGRSTTALLMGQPERLVTYDLLDWGVRNSLRGLAGKTDLRFELMDSRSAKIPPTNLLFIDSTHTYDHLLTELVAHHAQVRSWIAMHDTQRCCVEGWYRPSMKFSDCDVQHAGQAIPIKTPGLGAAIFRFLCLHPQWRIASHSDDDNGLTVLERISG